MKNALLSILLMAFGFPALSQTPEPWKKEVGVGINPSLIHSSIAYDYLYRWKAAKPRSWWLASANAGFQYFSPGIFYQYDSQSIRSDSGRTVRAGLSLGREWRNYFSEGAFITSGVEMGLGALYNYRQESIWNSRDLTQTPVVNVRNEWSPRAALNLFFGIGVWVSQNIGFSGQGWASLDLSGGVPGAAPLEFNSSMGFRYGINLRLGNTGTPGAADR